MTLIGLLLALQASPLDAIKEVGTKVVAFEREVLLLHEAVARIGKELEIKLACDERIRNEPIIVNATNLPARRLLECFATVCFAEWKREGDVFTLRRTQETNSRLESKRIDKREKDVAVAFDDVFKRATKPVEYDKLVPGLIEDVRIAATYSSSPEFGGRYYLGSPVRVLAEKLVARVGARRIASLPLNFVSFFCNDPTPAEQPFGFDCRELIEEFLASEARIAENTVDEIPVAADAGRDPNSVKEDWTEIRKSATNKRGVGKIILGFSVQPTTVLVWVRVFDNVGGLRSRVGFVRPVGNRYVVNDSGTPPLSVEQVRFATETQTYFRLTNPLQTPDLKPLNPGEEKVLTLIRKPVAHDPLNFGVAEALFKIAENSTLPMVARVPDSLLFEGCGRFTSREFDLKEILQEFLTHGISQRSEKDAILFLPYESTECELLRLPRKAPQSLYDESVPAKRLTLRCYCKFVLACDYRLDWAVSRWARFPMPYFGVDRFSALFDFNGSNSVLGALGAMTEVQFNSLLSGQEMTASALPPAAQSRLLTVARSLYGKQWTEARPMPEIRLAGTVTFPVGFSASATVRVKTAQSNVLQFDAELSKGVFTPTFLPLSLDEWGEMLVTEPKYKEDRSIEAAMPGRWFVGTQTRYTLIISEPGVASWETEFSLPPEFGASSKSVPYSELPEKTKKELEAAVKRHGGGI